MIFGGEGGIRKDPHPKIAFVISKLQTHLPVFCKSFATDERNLAQQGAEF
jgi:hypothetical protein